MPEIENLLKSAKNQADEKSTNSKSNVSNISDVEKSQRDNKENYQVSLQNLSEKEMYMNYLKQQQDTIVRGHDNKNGRSSNQISSNSASGIGSCISSPVSPIDKQETSNSNFSNQSSLQSNNSRKSCQSQNSKSGVDSCIERSLDEEVFSPLPPNEIINFEEEIDKLIKSGSTNFISNSSSSDTEYTNEIADQPGNLANLGSNASKTINLIDEDNEVQKPHKPRYIRRSNSNSTKYCRHKIDRLALRQELILDKVKFDNNKDKNERRSEGINLHNTRRRTDSPSNLTCPIIEDETPISIQQVEDRLNQLSNLVQELKTEINDHQANNGYRANKKVLRKQRNSFKKGKGVDILLSNDV